MLALLLTAALAAVAPRILSLEQALQTADEHQPDLRAERSNVDIVSSRADETRAGLFPQVSLNAARIWRTGNYVAQPGLLGNGIRAATTSQSSGQLYNGYSATATVSQLLFDFGQNFFRWRSARSLAEAEVDSFNAERLLIRLNVRVAYFNAHAQKLLFEVAKGTWSNEEKHLVQTQGFVDVGTQPEIALAQEKTAEANARLQLIQSENGYLTSKVQLNQAMGVEGSEEYDVEDLAPAPVQGEDRDLDSLMQEALAARPEFQSLQRQVHAEELLVDSVRGAYFPALSLQLNGTEGGVALNALAWNVSGQLLLTWPIFQGLLTRAQSAEAWALVRQLEAHRDSVRLQVRLEVEQARLGVRAAGAELRAAGEALTNANDRLRLAEGRYQTGVGSVIELGDAQVALTTAAAQRVKSEYDLATTRAQLTKALGRG